MEIFKDATTHHLDKGTDGQKLARATKLML